MKKGLFSKLVVIFCIFEITLMQVWAMHAATAHAVDASALLAANHGVFGGELLLLCLKRIMSGASSGQTETADVYEQADEKESVAADGG